MATTPALANTLRRSLLIKLISKPTPSREDVASVIELTASKVVEALQAQSMTLYLVEGNDIVFRHVYYSPTLWGNDEAKAATFKAMGAKLMELKLPLGKGVVGKVIAEGQPVFFRNTATQAPFMTSMAQTTGFEVCSMLTVPLKAGNVIIGAIQVLNKEPAAGTFGEFVDNDLALLQEVAEYSAALIQRMMDPKFQPSPDDTAKFIARLTNHPLVTSADELTIDENLVTAIGDAIIRREHIFPCKRTSPNSLGVLMTNPLDYARRESFQQATELVIDEIHIARPR
jgi:type IV pilus assembly protein PilB